MVRKMSSIKNILDSVWYTVQGKDFCFVWFFDDESHMKFLKAVAAHDDVKITISASVEEAGAIVYEVSLGEGFALP